MAHEPAEFQPPSGSQRRRGVVVDALIEKLEKVTIGRMTLLRERDHMRHALQELDAKLSQVQGEELELREALRDYGTAVGPMSQESGRAVPRRVHMESGTWVELRNKAQLLADGPPEPGHLKNAAIAMVRAILQTVESMQVRELFEMLRHQQIEVSSAQRLSQILSESNEFEADRSRGWSLRKVKS